MGARRVPEVTHTTVIRKVRRPWAVATLCGVTSFISFVRTTGRVHDVELLAVRTPE
jgi:hypothetical protein